MGKRRLVAALVAVVVLVTAGQAGATHLEPGLSMTLGGPIRLVNGVYLTVPVQVTCPAVFPAPYTFPLFEDLTVSVEQRWGRDLAVGRGGFSFSDGTPFGGSQLGTPLICDGTAKVYAVAVFPSGNIPFHGGPAVASGSAMIQVDDPTTWSGDVSSTATGPQSILIRG